MIPSRMAWTQDDPLGGDELFLLEGGHVYVSGCSGATWVPLEVLIAFFEAYILGDLEEAASGPSDVLIVLQECPGRDTVFVSGRDGGETVVTVDGVARCLARLLDAVAA
jgi:hypothetical protein